MTGKDRRLYGKFTLDFPDHPKIAILSNEAFRCLVEATLWSRQQMTDGWLARRYAVARWSLSTLQELCQNDDEKPSLVEHDKGWFIHDYADHQDTKADIEERRERNKLAGSKGGLAKAKRRAKRPASKSLSNSLSENVAETETETHTEVTTDVVTSERPARTTHGTRLPDNWTPDSFDTITTNGIDINTEYAKFCDYWHAQPGAKGRKADWDATWRNWLRRAAEQHTPRAPNTQQKNADLKENEFQALKREWS